MSRNVEALAALLAEYNQGTSDIDPAGLAAWLAARGVLCVDSLTDEQCRELADIGDSMLRGRAKDAIRAALRRCATGEDK